MKFEKIEQFLHKAGFQFIQEGIGFGAVKGRPAYLYQKNISGNTPQMIQLTTASENKDDVYPIFSINVPQKVRDSIYNILNDRVIEQEHVMEFK